MCPTMRRYTPAPADFPATLSNFPVSLKQVLDGSRIWLGLGNIVEADKLRGKLLNCLKASSWCSFSGSLRRSGSRCWVCWLRYGFRRRRVSKILRRGTSKCLFSPVCRCHLLALGLAVVWGCCCCGALPWLESAPNLIFSNFLVETPLGVAPAALCPTILSNNSTTHTYLKLTSAAKVLYHIETWPKFNRYIIGSFWKFA